MGLFGNERLDAFITDVRVTRDDNQTLSIKLVGEAGKNLRLKDVLSDTMIHRLVDSTHLYVGEPLDDALLHAVRGHVIRLIKEALLTGELRWNPLHNKFEVREER